MRREAASLVLQPPHTEKTPTTNKHRRQRDGANKRKRYAASGAAATPFNQSPAWMAAHGGLTRLGADYVSAEEYPFESAAQGGKGAVVAGAPILMQRRELSFHSVRVLGREWIVLMWSDME